MKYKFLTLLLLVIALLALAACAAPGLEATEPAGSTPGAKPTTTPSLPDRPEPIVTPANDAEVIFDPADSLTPIKKFLYENYGVAPADAQLVEQQEREWPDSCLGLAGPDEMCMQVITPGFQVTLSTPRGSFTFHTAQSLERFRLADTPSGIPSRPDSSSRFQWLLAGRLNVSPDQVSVLGSEAVEWPDTCLGVVTPDTLCGAVITPGYRITLSTPQGEVVIHTDANMVNYRTPQPLPGKDRSLLVWERSGGFAGICVRLVIGFDGSYQLTDCQDQTLLVENVMDTATFGQLIARAATFGITTWKAELPAGSADMFQDGFTFNGLGSQAADAMQQDSLNEFFSSLASSLENQPTTK